MSRIPTPAHIEDAREGAQATLNAVKAAFGTVPNLFRLTANSPAAVKGLVGFSTALSNGALDHATRERIALAVGQANGCDYCLTAHSYTARRVLGLTDAQIDAARAGHADDPKSDAALRFATRIVADRGRVPAEAVQAAKASGFSDAELVEIVAHVALNTLTNYLNETFDTEIDFPVLDRDAA